MQTGKINVQTENIFPVIKKFLYSDHEIFLRELISNAVDATQKLKTLVSLGKADCELEDLDDDHQHCGGRDVLCRVQERSRDIRDRRCD